MALELGGNLGKALAEASGRDVEQEQKLQALYGAIGTKMADAAAQPQTIPGTTETPETLAWKQTQVLKTEQKTQALIEGIGFPEMQAKLLQELSKNANELIGTTESLKNDKAVSLWEDPIQAIVNAFTIPWDEQKLEGLAQQRDQLNKSLTDITAGVTSAAASNKLIQSSVSEATIRETQAALEGELKKERLLGEAKALEQNVHGIKSAIDANKRQVEYTHLFDSWKKSEENQAFMREQRAAHREEQKRKLKALTDQEAAEQLTLSYVNRALAQEGKAQYQNVAQLKSRLITQKEKDRIEDLVNKGMDLSAPGGIDNYRHGDTVAEIIRFQDNNSILPKNNDQRTLMVAVREAAGAVGKGEDPAKKALTAENHLKAALDAMETVKADDNSNPMRAPTFETLALGFKDNPTFQKVIAPMITEGNKNISAHPSIVGPVLIQAVIDGKIKPNQAGVFLADLYKKGIQINNEATQIQKLTGYRQSRFIASVDIGRSPVLKASADIVTATGAAMLASGVGIVPGVAVSAVGLASEAMYATRNNVAFDFTDPVKASNYVAAGVANKLGAKINWAGKYADDSTMPAKYTEGVSPMYPPLFESSRVLGAK